MGDDKGERHLKLLGEGEFISEPLGDHDINLNRLDSLVNSMALYENDEDDPYHFLLREAIIQVIKAKQMYLAWLNEEY